MQYKPRKKIKQNPINYKPGQKEIFFNRLLDGLPSNLDQILLEGIYGRYYYKEDLKRGREFRYLGEMIHLFERHIGEYLPEMSHDDVLQYRLLIREMKKLPNNILVILPQEFTWGEQPYYDALKEAKKQTRVNPKKKNPNTPTTKENMIAQINATALDILQLVRNPEIQEGLKYGDDVKIKTAMQSLELARQWIAHAAGKVLMR